MENKFLYEALFIYDKYCHLEEIEVNCYEIKCSLSSNIFQAMLRILAYGGLITYRNNKFLVSKNDVLSIDEMKESDEYIKKMKNMSDLVKRIEMNKTGGFFKKLSDLEYEIYSRCNYPVSYDMGLVINENCNFNKSSILDLGGNSGGLASAIARKNMDSSLTVLDQKIPCTIGKELKKEHKIKNIEFVMGDFFKVDLNKSFDYIILANVLHDYEDSSCIKILESCKKHCHKKTKIIIAEDILTYETKPVSVLEHGLRLSINTFEGRQRTINELEVLLDGIGFVMDRKYIINNVQSMICFEEE